MTFTLHGSPGRHSTLDPHTAIRSRLLLPAMHMEQALLELFGFESWGCMEHQMAADATTDRMVERLGIARKRIKKVLMHLHSPEERDIRILQRHPCQKRLVNVVGFAHFGVEPRLP